MRFFSKFPSEFHGWAAMDSEQLTQVNVDVSRTKEISVSGGAGDGGTTMKRGQMR